MLVEIIFYVSMVICLIIEDVLWSWFFVVNFWVVKFFFIKKGRMVEYYSNGMEVKVM